MRYDEELIVPIIENTPLERDLEDRMYATMQEYPGSTAILVRRHGIYVWGDTWQKAKTMYVINTFILLFLSIQTYHFNCFQFKRLKM